MTVTNSTRKTPVVPNGNVGPHPFPFRVQQVTDIKAYRVDPVTLAQTLLTQGGGAGQYQVSINTITEGGNITLGADLAATFTTGLQLLIVRDVDDQQGSKIPTASPFPEKVIENALDKSTMRDIEIQDDVKRSLKAPLGAPANFDGTTPTLTPGRVAKVNPSGTGYVESTYDPDTQQAGSAASAAAALASQIAAAASAAEADADADQTAADVTQTGLDRIQTGLDRIATGADRVQTGLDKVATAADRVQTGLDRVQTGIDATNSANSAATATAVDQGASFEANVQANGEVSIFANPNMWMDTTLQNTGRITAAGTVTSTTYLNFRGRRAIQVVGGVSHTKTWSFDIADLNLVAGQPASFGIFIDSKTTATNTHFSLSIVEKDSGGSTLATTVQNGPTGTIVAGTPTFSSPQPVRIENLTLNASTARVDFVTTFNSGASQTIIVSRPLIRWGDKADWSAPPYGHLPDQNESPNLFRDPSFVDPSKSLIATGTGSNPIIKHKGQTCLQVLSTGNRSVTVDHLFTELGITSGDKFSMGFWVDYVAPGVNAAITLNQTTTGNSQVKNEATFSINGATNRFPMFVPIEGMTADPTAGKIRFAVGGGNGLDVRVSRPVIIRGARIRQKDKNDFWTVSPRGPIMVDYKAATVRFPDFDMCKNGFTKRTFFGSALNATNTQQIVKALTTTTTSTNYYLNISLAITGGSDPIVATTTPGDLLDLSNYIYLGTSNAYGFHSPFYSVSNYDALQTNEIANGNFNGGVVGTGITLATGTITSTAVADLNAVGVFNSIKLAPGSGTYIASIRQSITDQIQGAPCVFGMLVYADDANFDFTGASAPIGPGVLMRQTNTALVRNSNFTSFIKITNNLRLYYFETDFVSGLAAGQDLSTIELRVSVPSAHTNNYEVSGFFLSTKTRHMMRVDWRNWLRSLINDRTLGAQIAPLVTADLPNRMTSAESRLSTLESAGSSGTVTSTADIILPDQIFALNGVPFPIHKNSLITLRDQDQNSIRLGMFSVPASPAKALMIGDFRGTQYINPDSLGSTAKFVLQSPGTPDKQKQRTVNIIKSNATGKTSSPKIAFIGDSRTVPVAARIKPKIAAATSGTPTYIGTQVNGLTGSDRSEGHSGWRATDFTYARTSFPAVAPGGEAAYIAGGDGQNVNPFIRATVGGDNAAYVKNGYIFDYANYLSRFSLQTPTHVVIHLGTNDITNNTGATAAVNITDNVSIMVAQIKNAIPGVKIGIFAPYDGTITLGNTYWFDRYLVAMKKVLEVFNGRTAENIWVLCPHIGIDMDMAFDVNSSGQIVDSQTKQVTADKGEYYHPNTVGQELETDHTAAFLINQMT